MSTCDFITELFCRVDDAMHDVTKPDQSRLHPSELVTIAMLYTLKSARGKRAFDRWLRANYLGMFPNLTERTRLFRAISTFRVRAWADRFLACPTALGIVDTMGVEMIHPYREGRAKNPIYRKGYSNHRWIVGVKVCAVVNEQGLICDWECESANVADNSFHPLIEKFKDKMHVLADKGFHAKAGNPDNLIICNRGERNERMTIETVFSLLCRVLNLKKVGERNWPPLEAHIGFAFALYNLLVTWNGTPTLSIAEFDL